MSEPIEPLYGAPDLILLWVLRVFPYCGILFYLFATWCDRKEEREVYWLFYKRAIVAGIILVGGMILADRMAVIKELTKP